MSEKDKDVHNTSRYYILSFIVIAVVPLLLVFLYEWLGGGVLNGLAGSWRQPIINPDLLLLGFNPIVLVSGYLGLAWQYRKLLKNDTSVWSKGVATFLLVVATIVTIVGIFWKALTI